LNRTPVAFHEMAHRLNASTKVNRKSNSSKVAIHP
jgi:hypothetical protein